MPSRILLIAPNWLGDAVMALPALAAIRASRPSDDLLVAGRASTVSLFSMVPGVNEVVRLDSRGGLVGAVSWAEDVATLRSARADVAVLLPNSFRSAWTAYRAGIAERWGYAADLRGRLLTRRVRRQRAAGHHAEYYLRLTEALGFAPPSRPRLPLLEVPREAHERAAALLANLGLAPGTVLVGLAPGAAYGKAKQWPPRYYGVLAAGLHARFAATSLIFGARADVKTTREVVRAAARETASGRNDGAGKPAVAVDLAGQTDLALLAALMTRCRTVVSNDSGAMHVAAAAGVPVIAVFGASNERGTAPLPCDVETPPRHEVLTAPAWCRPCMLRECPIDHRCMRRILPERVAETVESVLR